MNRVRVAKSHFASLGMEVKGRITSAKIPFSEVPAAKLPAIYFTRTGQHPVVIQESSSAGYSIRLWDGRESICHRSRLEKTLEPVGYFLPTEGTSGQNSALRTLLSALVDEKKFVALGVGNGAVNCSLLILFVFALFHIFQSAFPVAEMSSVGLAFTGVTAAVLSTFGFLQARFLVNAWFENLSDTNRSREIEMPPPFPIQALTSASSGRIMTEAASAPFFLAAGAIFVGYDVTSVAAWGALTGCAIPAFLFLSNLPDLLKLWKQALWLFEEKLSIFEEDTDDEVVEETPGTEWKITFDDSMVRAHNLFLAHPEENRSPLVDHISLKVAKGEKVGFIGKSNGEVPVFLRLISGMLEADRGIVWLDNKMVAGDQSHTIGWFSERNSLIDGTL
ncbi:MAG: hypothetical protein P1V20_23945, partial [Verrucomicrobiales bacterium]|nr:hypothetical protein [Verrucomicrobiales bacterium]